MQFVQDGQVGVGVPLWCSIPSLTFIWLLASEHATPSFFTMQTLKLVGIKKAAKKTKKNKTEKLLEYIHDLKLKEILILTYADEMTKTCINVIVQQNDDIR